MLCLQVPSHPYEADQWLRTVHLLWNRRNGSYLCSSVGSSSHSHELAAPVRKGKRYLAYIRLIVSSTFLLSLRILLDSYIAPFPLSPVVLGCSHAKDHEH